MTLTILSKVCLAFFIYIIVVYIFIGITTIPSEGDSLNYHIPFAKAYLNGTILNPAQIKDAVPLLKYFPGASEGILSLFYLLRIPPNLFNVLGVIILVTSCYHLGIRTGLKKPLALIFALSVGTLHGVVRWLNAQTIDIWLASWFVLSLFLLLNPKKSVVYFLQLGFVFGMLIGSKNSGPLFGFVLFIFYIRSIITFVTIKRFFAFLVPFSICGLFWYIRNYVLMGDPIYPEDFLFFQGAHFRILDDAVWKMIFLNPVDSFGTLNAYISEYMVWIFALPIGIYYLGRSIVTKKFNLSLDPILVYIIIGLLNVFIFLFLPSGHEFSIKLSVFRYSFSAFIPLILSTYLIAAKYKKEKYVAVAALGSMFFVGFPTIFAPKLLFVYIPIIWLIFSDNFTMHLMYERLKELRKRIQIY